MRRAPVSVVRPASTTCRHARLLRATSARRHFNGSFPRYDTSVDHTSMILSRTAFVDSDPSSNTSRHMAGLTVTVVFLLRLIASYGKFS